MGNPVVIPLLKISLRKKNKNIYSHVQVMMMDPSRTRVIAFRKQKHVYFLDSQAKQVCRVHGSYACSACSSASPFGRFGVDMLTRLFFLGKIMLQSKINAKKELAFVQVSY